VPSWIQHPITGKLIPRDEYVRPRLNGSAAVHGDVEAFVSIVDGQLIDDRGKLRRHNEKHGCTNSQDYSDQWIKSRRSSIEREGERKLKQSRIHDINAAIARHGG
jgi:hypothetical protein